MARSRLDGLTPREMQIMQVVWDEGEASVEQVQKTLPDPLVDSTIRTMLQIMEDKKYVASRKQGRANIYSALIKREEVQKSAVKQMIQRVFGGSGEMLLARLVEDEQVDLDELEQIQKRLEQRKKEQES